MSYISNQNTDTIREQVKLLFPEWSKTYLDVKVKFVEENNKETLRVIFTTNIKGTYSSSSVARESVWMKFTEFRECCGICILSGLTVYSQPNQPKGFGRKLLEVAEKLAAYMGYSMLVGSTSLTENPAMYHILRHSPGWVLDYSFENSRTRNVVASWHKELWRQPPVTEPVILRNHAYYQEQMARGINRICHCSICRLKREKETAKKKAAEKKAAVQVSPVLSEETHPLVLNDSPVT